MADYKKIDLQIGTEEQFEEKKLSLPVGTLVGITDPIHESELDTALQTKINEVNNKLTKPTNPSAESAVTMLADGTVGTKPLTSITGKSEVYVGTPDPTGGEILWIDPNGTSGGGGSSGGGKLYLHKIHLLDTNTYMFTEVIIYLLTDTLFTFDSFVSFLTGTISGYIPSVSDIATGYISSDALKINFVGIELNGNKNILNISFQKNTTEFTDTAIQL